MSAIVNMYLDQDLSMPSVSIRNKVCEFIRNRPYCVTIQIITFVSLCDL